MNRRRLFTVLFAVVFGATAWWTYQTISEKFMEPTYRADRLFKPYGEEIYRIAQRIERGQTITVGGLKALPGGVNKRYGEEITLLFHALGARNVEAMDTLLDAGADPYMIDIPSKGSTRSFVYYLTLPGHPTDPQLGFPFINTLIKLYLKHGGDPNHRLGGAKNDPLIAGVALMDNYEGVDILLDAGADPWMDNAHKINAMIRLAADGLSHAELNRLIDRGYFDNVPVTKLREFLSWLSLYEQRGDERSLANQAIGRRVLKRHPNYPTDEYTEQLFQGPIPWKEIQNEQ